MQLSLINSDFTENLIDTQETLKNVYKYFWDNYIRTLYNLAEGKSEHPQHYPDAIIKYSVFMSLLSDEAQAEIIKIEQKIDDILPNCNEAATDLYFQQEQFIKVIECRKLENELYFNFVDEYFS